jgi:hypothetical protein
VAPRRDERAHINNEVHLDAVGANADVAVEGTTYHWVQTIGPEIPFTTASDGRTLSFNAPDEATLVGFVVHGEFGGIESDRAATLIEVVDIADNTMPSIDLCTSSLQPQPTQEVVLQGVAIDPEFDTISTQWIQDPPDTVTLTVRNPGDTVGCSTAISISSDTQNNSGADAQIVSFSAPATGTTVKISYEACDSLGDCDAKSVTIMVP